MKKGLLVFTGIIELIFFILVFILSLYNLAYQFLASTIEGLIGESLADTLVSVFENMYKPLIELIPLDLDAGLLNIILSALMTIVSLMLLIFATKKLAYARLYDFEYLQKRRILRSFGLFELLVFAGAAATMVLAVLGESFEFDMMTTLPKIVNAALMLFIVLFTFVQVGKMNKAYKKTLDGTGGVNYAAHVQPTTTYTQPEEVPQYQPNMIDNATNEGDLYAGYPDKVKADLERLDRLYANGALTEDSFQAMRTKILKEVGVIGDTTTDPNAGTDPNGNPPQV